MHADADPAGRLPAAADHSPAARERRATGFAAFAKLARITSCFPAAFAPVTIRVPAGGPAAREPSDVAIGRKLGVWGALPPGEYHLLDGGILENKPFTSTIDTIFYRMADRPVQRHLLYVEPDPERFEGTRSAPPTFLSAALDSLTKLPSYESIAADLRRIVEHNDTVERFTRALTDVRRRMMAAPVASASFAPGVDLVSADLGVADQGETLYARDRLQSLGEMVIEAVLGVGPGTGGTAEGLAREQVTELRRSFDERLCRLSAAQARVLFSCFDVEFRLRRVIHLTYVLEELDIDAGDGGADAESRQQLRRAIAWRVELLEIVRAGMQYGLGRQARHWFHASRELGGGAPSAELWDRIFNWLSRFIASDAALASQIGPDGPLLGGVLEQVREALAARATASLPEQASQAGDDGYVSLLAANDRVERALLERASGTTAGARVLAEYLRYREIDRVLFPMQFMSGVGERDVIRTVRVSPFDAQRGLSKADSLSQKVCGNALAHFGAFLKRSWRSNDLLFGRLDGSCQILETLLNTSWLSRTLGTPAQRREALARLGVLDAEATDRDARAGAVRRWLVEAAIFPRAGEEAVTAAADAVAELLDPLRAPDASDGSRERLLDALVSACHLDIVDTDYKTIVEDAINERLDWRQSRVAGSDAQAQGAAAPRPAPESVADPSPPKFDLRTRAFDVTLDNAVLASAARMIANDALERPASAAERAALLKANPVAAETIARDIPRVVLLRIVAQALLVLSNCVINSLGAGRASDVRSSRIYRFLVDWPLRAFHAIAVSLARAPRWRAVFAAAAGVYLVLAVAANLVLGPAAADQPLWRWAIVQVLFRALPLVCAVAAVVALSGAEEYRARRNGGRSLVGVAVWALTRLVPAAALVSAAFILSERETPALCSRFGAAASGTCFAVARTSWLCLAVLVGAAIGRMLARPAAGARSHAEKVLTAAGLSADEMTTLEARVLAGTRLPVPVNPDKVVVVSARKRRARLARLAVDADRLADLEREVRVLRQR
jgi:patatin-related protein